MFLEIYLTNALLSIRKPVPKNRLGNKLFAIFKKAAFTTDICSKDKIPKPLKRPVKSVSFRLPFLYII